MCVLRAYGEDFDVDAFLVGSPLEPCAVMHRGVVQYSKSKRSPPEYSGFHASVCDAEWTGVHDHVAGAMTYLERHSDELQRLRAYPGVEVLLLDVPVDLRLGRKEVAVQGESFPIELVRLAGRTGVALGITIYPASEPSESVK